MSRTCIMQYQQGSLIMSNVKKMIWIFSIYFLEFCVIARASNSVSKSQEMTEVFSVVSGLAHLPCDLTPPNATILKDSPRLVLWYKNDDPQPIYSYDARFSTVKHWSEDRNFGPRSVFKAKNTNPAQLVISAVQMEDKGIYKCRVDFRNSPTVTTKIKLNIVEEPNVPMIMDNDGISVMRDIGPFRLRQPLILVCLVEGGNPKPEVSWWRDDQLWDDDQDPKTYEDVLQNTLVISQLDRTYHDANFECRAINNNVTQPKSTSVTIRLEMPILQMTISNLPDPVTADVKYDLLCQVTGSQPLPTISWTLDNTQLPSNPVQISHNNNMTSSGLEFTPKITDKGKVLACRADTRMFPSVNSSQVLNVYYIPIVNMEIINNVDPSNIREGGELVLRCRINAHPWVYRILWYRDGEELVSSENVLIDEQTLRLKHMSKQMSGQYVCSASNVEGDGFSKPLLISVNYKPVCVAPTIQYKGTKIESRHTEGDKNVTKEERVGNEELGIDLICEVDSKPKSATYRWLFNSSQTRFEIPSGESKMSFNNYRPSTDQESGQVLCWASNDLGEQTEPCVFHVVPLSTPQPPSACEITNHTTSTVEVSCVPGFDGGLDQHFVINVYETVNNTQVLIASNWTDDPTLYIWGLEPGSNYIISVMAVNDRGESSPVYVGGSTGSGSLVSQYLPSIHEAKLPSLLFIIVGCLLALMVIGSLITAIVAIKSRKRAKERKKNRVDEQKPFVSQNGDTNGAQSNVNLKSISHPNDLTEDQLAQFREAEALLEHADDMIQIQPLSPSISQRLNRERSNGSINRKVSFRNEDLVCTCGSLLRGTSVGGYTNGYHVYNSYNSIERRGPHERGASVPLLSNHHSENTSIYPPVERAVVKTFSIDKMRPICPTCNPSGDTPYPPDFPPIPLREAVEEDTEKKTHAGRYARSLSPNMNGMNDTKTSDDSKSSTNTKYSKDDSSFSYNTENVQNSSTSPLLSLKRSTSPTSSNKNFVYEKIKGQPNNGISDQSA